MPGATVAVLSLAASLRDDGNLHRPEWHELFRQVEHRGSVAGVHCPLAIAEQRERDRGDRSVGTVRGQHARVHTFRQYDVDVDTSVAAPQECAEAILAGLDSRLEMVDIRGSMMLSPATRQRDLRVIK